MRGGSGGQEVAISFDKVHCVPLCARDGNDQSIPHHLGSLGLPDHQQQASGAEKNVIQKSMA